MRKSFLCLVGLVLASLPLCRAHAAVPEPPLKQQAYQGHSFDAGKEEVFNATFTVFQDLGCIVEHADLRAGYITARSAQAPSHEFSSKSFTAFILPKGKHGCRVRLTAVGTHFGVLGSWDYLVEQPGFYERFFARITDSLATQRLIWGN